MAISPFGAAPDALVVEKVKSGEVARAVDIRNRLPVICSAPKALKKFANRAYDFEDAYEQAVDAGADSTPYKKLAAFRQWLAKPAVATALGRTQGPLRRARKSSMNSTNSRSDGCTEVVRGQTEAQEH